jgi:hypothetical protein
MVGRLTFQIEFQNNREAQGASFLKFCKTVAFFCKKQATRQWEGENLFTIRRSLGRFYKFSGGIKSD